MSVAVIEQRDISMKTSLMKKIGAALTVVGICSPPALADKRLDDDVPEEEKTRRIVELQALQRSIQEKLNSKLVGCAVDVLIDSVSRRRDHEVAGRTTQNIVVNFPGAADWMGRTAEVLVERAGPHSVWGHAIDQRTLATGTRDQEPYLTGAALAPRL